jgi:hypothetical protein
MAGSGASTRWETALDGLAGTINITTLGGGRIVATFEFLGVPDKRNTVGGTRMVTQGRIDLPYMGTLSPVPDDVGSKLSAKLGGVPYNAWAVNVRPDGLHGWRRRGHRLAQLAQRDRPHDGRRDRAGQLSDQQRGAQRSITVGRNGGDASSCCWGQNAGGDTGTIVITSLTPTRVKGTFSGTLQPQPGKPATAPLVITDGVFDVGTR